MEFETISVFCNSCRLLMMWLANNSFLWRKIQIDIINVSCHCAIFQFLFGFRFGVERACSPCFFPAFVTRGLFGSIRAMCDRHSCLGSSMADLGKCPARRTASEPSNKPQG